MAFMAMRCEHLHTTGSLDCLVRILFECSGARMETPSQVVYWVNTAGVSLAYRRLLTGCDRAIPTFTVEHRGS